MIIIIFYLILLAIIHAKLELMIEGKRMGWASNLPCWEISNKISNWILGNKPITGYHFWLLVMFLLLFHSPFLFIQWNPSSEYKVLGLYFLYWIIEDFFWFMENPLFRFRNFKKGKIYWHKRWIGKRIPVSYLISAIIGTLLILLGIK
jgi:hypothetical protein